VQARLAKEPAWYDARARKNQRWYRAIKILQLIAAALVPMMAGMGVSAWITGGLGSAIVVMEGVQQLYQFQEHWMAYRSLGRDCATSNFSMRPVPAITPPPPALRRCLPNAWKR
jgi:hypothetical protein